MDAAEVAATDIPAAHGGVLAASQSGETKDVLRCVQRAMAQDVTALSVVNAVGSLIARTTKLGVYLNAGRENAVASTKAFTTQVTVMALLACWFHDLRQAEGNPVSPKFAELMAALHRLPISFGMGLRLQDQCRGLAQKLKDSEHVFILGKGYAEPIARFARRGIPSAAPRRARRRRGGSPRRASRRDPRNAGEGALKIKECCYLHAEAFSGGAVTHRRAAAPAVPDARRGRRRRTSGRAGPSRSSPRTWRARRRS